jgi:hypothetical protein
MMNHLSPWDRRNNATPRDTFQDTLNAAFRKNFEALKGDIEAICYRANVNVKPDIEAYGIFCDGVDSAFDIDWRMSGDE